MTHGTPPGSDDDRETVAPYARPPQFEQPQYAQPPQSYGQSQHGRSLHGQPAQSSRRSLGVVALVLALAGAGVAALGLLGVRWTRVPSAGGIGEGPTFLALRRLFVALGDTEVSGKPTFTIAYFDWAAFVLLGAALLLAILAALPTSAAPTFRILGFVVGLLSAGAAVFVPALDGAHDLSLYLKGGLGLFLVAGGSLLMAIGALIGSRTRG